MKRCIRNKLGRFQKHNFPSEIDTGAGFESICKNCRQRRFQTYFERKMTEYWAKHLLNAYKLSISKVSLPYSNFTGKKIKWRRYGKLAGAN